MSLAFTPEVERPAEDSAGISVARGERLRVGIGDGVSRPYVRAPDRFPYAGISLTTGQIASRMLVEVIADQAFERSSNRGILAEANRRFREWCGAAGLEVRASNVGGCVGVLLAMDQGITKITQWGDAGFIVEDNDGGFTFSHNQLAAHDQIGEQQFRALLNEQCKKRGYFDLADAERLAAKDVLIECRRDTWAEYGPLWKERLDRNANGHGEAAYGIMNGTTDSDGHSGVLRHLCEIELPTSAVRRILLFSDGYLSLPAQDKAGEAAQVAKKAFEEIERLGFARAFEERRTGNGAVHLGPKGPEATAVYLNLVR